MPTTNFPHFADFVNEDFYVGIDVHKKSWTVTIRTLGLEVGHFTQPPSAEALASYLTKTFPGGSYHSVYEAGFCGTTIHEHLSKLGIQNIIVNPGDIPITDKQKKTKTDLHDSRFLADCLEKKSLKAIYILPREQQELRSLFRLRVSKSRDLTRAINKLKGFLIYFGVKLPEPWNHAYLSKKALGWLNNLELATQAGSLALQEYLQDVLYRRERLVAITRQLRSQVQLYYPSQYEYLLSIPGIGMITAIALLAEIGDFNRFKDPDQYCSFLGLMPWECSSGEKSRTKGIQPRCNHYLRSVIIEASWSAIRKAPRLLQYYRKHAIKNSKHAIVKVARKLALIARSVIVNQQYYDPTWPQGPSIPIPS
jgi:transposase